MTNAEDVESCASHFRAEIVGDFRALCPDCAQISLVLCCPKYYDGALKKRPASVLEHAHGPNPLDTSERADRLPQG